MTDGRQADSENTAPMRAGANELNGRAGGAKAEPGYYTDLDAALENAWTSLKIGAANRRSGFHTANIATIGQDGFPAVRTVVLRGFDGPLRRLTFHTDVRSKKYAELTANPFFAAHFYDPGAKIQLRLSCIATLETHNGVSRAAWDRAMPMSRECYRQGVKPGSRLQNPSRAADDGLPDEQAFSNFAVVSGRIEALEWLYLAAAGHRRAAFDWRDGELRASWLAP